LRAATHTESIPVDASASRSPRALPITVNGEAREIRDGATLADLVAELGLGGRKIAVAVGRDVVPRGSYAARAVRAGDRIEILEAVGGG
jgi:thiamine biosynthesis protein ThiS